MSRPIYPARSWFDPRLEMRASPIHDRGVFATALILIGEVIAISGGILYSSEDWKAGTVQLDPARYNEDQVDEDLFLASPIEDLDYFFNHSCDPNTWAWTARRVIQPGEEVTIDYAMGIFAAHYRLAPCNCGTPLCRREITGSDWTRPDLQGRYGGHFPPFIERRIHRRE